ncbi:MAG: type II toxin-antitoxin system RelE/ParE family toxin [Rhodospirillaceae bacterium]|nr:type II toxin-antitoxin system RelE/ParE family toxin [Rhodospirillaceae bacterium]
MIRSFANSATRKFVEEFRSDKFPGLDVEDARELISMINAAQSLKDISPLAGVGLHALKGNRKGQWAIKVNAGWRICFRLKEGDAFDVEIVDYH